MGFLDGVIIPASSGGGSGGSAVAFANAIRVGPAETYTTLKDAGATEGWDNHFYLTGDVTETSQVSIGGGIVGEYYIFLAGGITWNFDGVVTNLNITSTGAEYRLIIEGVGSKPTITGTGGSTTGVIQVSRTNNGLWLKNVTLDAYQFTFSNRTMIKGGQVFVEDVNLINSTSGVGVPAIWFGNTSGWNPADIQRKWPMGMKNVRYTRESGSAAMDDVIKIYVSDPDIEIDIEDFSVINLAGGESFDFTSSGSAKVNCRKLSFEGSSRTITVEVDSLDICEYDLTGITFNVRDSISRIQGSSGNTTVNLTERNASIINCQSVNANCQADNCKVSACNGVSFPSTQSTNYLTFEECYITSTLTIAGDSNFLRNCVTSNVVIEATANDTAYMGLSFAVGSLTDNGVNTVNLTNANRNLVWPSIASLPKSGFYLETQFGVSAGQFAYGFDRMVFANSSGETLELVSQSGTFTPSGMTNSTHYYVYLTTYDSGPITVVVSTDSVRKGDSFTGLTGANTHFREVGEFYVDSGGNVIEFGRIQDQVRFNTPSDAQVFTGQTLKATVDTYSYPAAAPERAAWVEFELRQDSGSVGRMQAVLSNAVDGLVQRKFIGNYQTGSGTTYDGKLNDADGGMKPEQPDLTAANVYIRGHWTFTSSATYQLNLKAYTWEI